MATKSKHWSNFYPNFLAIVVAFFVFSSSCQAGLVNQSIDDTYGDVVTGFKPLYLPTDGVWKDRTCNDCVILPNPPKAGSGTWTAAVYKPELNNINITLSFTGVAVWVFFILSNANMAGDGIITDTRCNFTLDSLHVGSFVHEPDMSTTELIYNTTVFSKTSLDNINHTLIISPSDLTSSTYINFDYALYMTVENLSPPATFEASTSSPIPLPSNTATPSSTVGAASQTNNKASAKPSSPAGPIVGAVLGSLALIMVLFLCTHCRKFRTNRPLPTRFLLNAATSELSGRNIVLSKPHQNQIVGFVSGPFVRSKRPLAPSSALIPRGDQGRVRKGGNAREAVRAERQMQIDRRIELAQRQMDNLSFRESLLQRANQGETRAELLQQIEALQAQVHDQRGQIDHLIRQRQSDWALGLSDESPPAYTQEI